MPERSENVPVRVANLTEDPMPIRAETIVAKLDAAEVCGTEEFTTPKGDPNRIKCSNKW